MEEIAAIVQKYDRDHVNNSMTNIDDVNRFSFDFFTDVAEIYDVFSRMRNTERDPHGFSLDDAPILGLLVKISKLLRELAVYHRANKAEFVALF